MATELSERFSGRYLRYQFDNAAQILRHCRLVEGAVLLFFPDPAAALPIRARALMELCLTASDQPVAISAQVHSPEKRGSWLAIRALSVVAGLHAASSAPRRSERRLAFDQLAWVEPERGPVLACPVLDVSRKGARLWGIPGEVPRRGDRVRVRLPGAPGLGARIAWAHGREAGIRFDEENEPAAASLYARVERMWSAARFASHDPRCQCASGGATVDPPAPPILRGAMS